MKIAVIIQARMTSTRLPGKIMLSLSGKPVLENLIDRIKLSKHDPLIIIATTTNKQDDIVCELAEKNNLCVFRGSEDNVLERYYFAAKEYKCDDVIVRITSDCPLYEPLVLDDMLDIFIESTSDYMSNTVQKTFPRGLDTEILSFESLEKTYNEASTQACLEHVTPYIYRNTDKFTVNHYTSTMFQERYKRNLPENLSEYRWTLDTIDDFKLIGLIYNEFKDNMFNIWNILEAYIKNPFWKDINKHIEQKEVGI